MNGFFHTLSVFYQPFQRCRQCRLAARHSAHLVDLKIGPVIEARITRLANVVDKVFTRRNNYRWPLGSVAAGDQTARAGIVEISGMRLPVVMRMISSLAKAPGYRGDRY